MQREASTSGETPVLQLRGVRRSYAIGDRTFDALHDVDLAIHRGEFVALTGPSGSGKSTLLQLMGALDRPTAGQVMVEGTDIGRLSSTELARLRGSRIGFVFQGFNLFPTVDALENVELPMVTVGRPRGPRRERAARLLEAVGLAPRAHHRPSQLSGGERQRVAIARAMANEPAFILADEPTGNLDSRNGAEVMDLLEDLNRKGTTLVVVTHDASISARAGRIVRLMDGAIVSDTRQAPRHPGGTRATGAANPRARTAGAPDVQAGTPGGKAAGVGA